MSMRPIADTASAILSDHRRYPGCRLLVVCTVADGRRTTVPSG
jgi:hypothetical protein